MKVKAFGSTKELLAKLQFLSPREDRGIPGVGVKSIDIRRKVNCESIYLDGH